MKNIKKFNESWNIFNKEENSSKDIEYKNQFLKTHEERTKSEKIIVDCLYHLELKNSENARYLGAIEGVLLMEGFLKSGDFNFKEKEEKFLFMTFKTKESYREYMIRYAKNFLKERNIL